MSKKKKKASKGKRIELVLKSDRDADIEEFLKNQKSLGKSPTIRLALRIVIAEYGKDDLLKSIVDMKAPAKDSKDKKEALARELINPKKERSPQKQISKNNKHNEDEEKSSLIPVPNVWEEENEFDKM